MVKRVVFWNRTDWRVSKTFTIRRVTNCPSVLQLRGLPGGRNFSAHPTGCGALEKARLLSAPEWSPRLGGVLMSTVPCTGYSWLFAPKCRTFHWSLLALFFSYSLFSLHRTYTYNIRGDPTDLYVPFCPLVHNIIWWYILQRWAEDRGDGNPSANFTTFKAPTWGRKWKLTTC